MPDSEFGAFSEHDQVHKGILRRVEELEAWRKEVDGVLGVLRVGGATLEERIGMLVKLLEEFKATTNRQLQDMNSKLTELDRELKEMRTRPGRMWDGFILAILSAGLGGVITLLVQTILRK